ncbi:hypothetical protein DRW41_13370 [Neobacillus piezotolerans]|uniref:Uncharacterized protein n=1 Tax=Neobacillus piezotolerans TaxID=2259171 RepID=A0A3D8GPV4_9BACI|nr:hypothetical protein [Neobacillus piezotolerans]RDU36514.1 hypothetical protein DRW41_13370 [Neobacillus piezotolerans]
MEKSTRYTTPAIKRPSFTIETGDTYPNPESIPGGSVEEHKQLEEANTILTGDEIRQQNENL